MTEMTPVTTKDENAAGLTPARTSLQTGAIAIYLIAQWIFISSAIVRRFASSCAECLRERCDVLGRSAADSVERAHGSGSHMHILRSKPLFAARAPLAASTHGMPSVRTHRS